MTKKLSIFLSTKIVAKLSEVSVRDPKKNTYPGSGTRGKKNTGYRIISFGSKSGTIILDLTVAKKVRIHNTVEHTDQ